MVEMKDFIGWKITDIVTSGVLGKKSFMIESPKGKEKILAISENGNFSVADFDEIKKGQ